MHIIVLHRHFLLGTRSQIRSSRVVIETKFTSGQHTRLERPYSTPIRRLFVYDTAPRHPKNRNGGRATMNRAREIPISKPKERPQIQDPAENSQLSSQYPRAEHVPNTKQEEDHVYVLTLKITAGLASSMNEFRERYFPKYLNRTPAHLTLFHALPHSQLHVLDDTLAQTSANMDSFHVSAGKAFRMRRGVGINVGQGYRNMKGVHTWLRSQWLSFLSEQDAGGFRPHWTAMNKVNDEEVVDKAFDTIQRELSTAERDGQALGLVLWNYNGGDWELTKEYMFESATKSSRTPG